MLVKCKICGNKIQRADAYKVVVKDKNNYYCNESEYKNWILQKENKDNTYKLIYGIFERKITNTILYKEIHELSEIYTYEKILAYLKENEEYLCKVMKKDFNNEYGQIRYFTAILKNSLADFKYKNEIEKKNIEVDMPEIKFKKRQKRKPLTEYEEEVGDELSGTL